MKKKRKGQTRRNGIEHSRLTDTEERRGLLGQEPMVVIAIAILVFVTFMVYCKSLSGEFVYDDRDYVTKNLRIQQGLTPSSIIWALKTNYESAWYPLVWLSYMVDIEMGGKTDEGKLNPFPFHVTNLLFHIGAVLLLFLFLRRATGATWPSGFAAGLFALHPLHVESVAWITERKDVLSAFFWMATMYAYTRYAERMSVVRYVLVMLMFLFGIMSKAMLVTLPFTLLLADYWPLRRKLSFWRLLVEKIPLFAMAFVSSVMIYIFNRESHRLGELPLSFRIQKAIVAYALYLWKTVWPTKLAVHYPQPNAFEVWEVAISAGILLGLTALVWLLGKSYRYLWFGWLWYMGTLVPVIGLVQVGVPVMIADRFSYIPHVGLFVIVAWGARDIVSKLIPSRATVSRRILVGLAIIVLGVLAAVTANQAQYWKDGITLWKHALAVTTNNDRAHNNLGVALDEKKQYEKSFREFQKALAINPDYADAHNNLALALDKRGNKDLAIKHYLEALRCNPLHADAHSNLGTILFNRGQVKEAEKHFRLALEISPEYADALTNLGASLAIQGKVEEAVKYFKKALQINPERAETHKNLGTALYSLGRHEEAIREWKEATRLKPDYADAHCRLATALCNRGDYAEAWLEARLCVKYGGRLDPGVLETLMRKMPNPPQGIR